MKKIALGALCFFAFFCIISVYFIGGQFAAYIWNIAVFILAPIAMILLIIQLIVLIVSLCKKKRLFLNITYIAITIIFVLPITVLFGVSTVTYPTNAKPKDAVTVTMPINDAVVFGGKEYKSHAMWPSERYAYDIVKEPHDVGDHIEQKQVLGKVGNSGTTSEPHLHIQHQRNNPKNMVFPTCAEGLPLIFN